MFEAALALVLAAQRTGITAGGPPPPLLRLEISDMTTRVTTSFGVHRRGRGESGPYRVDRIVQRGEAGHGRDSLRLDECPDVGPLLARALRLPLPSPTLARMTVLDPDTPRNLTWYRIEGLSVTGSGELGRLMMSAVELQGAAPSPLASWARAMADAFQACLDRRGPSFLEEGSADDD